MIELYDHQKEAIEKMKNGCILCGEGGSGKSRTALAYYFLQEGGELGDVYVPMRPDHRRLYIITTARKRDTLDWSEEMLPFLLSTEPDTGIYDDACVVDSWNNIAKYVNVRDAFFIFDEQRAVSTGKWARSFIKIARNNKWIMLSATPGDCWLDYRAVFVANGFYRDITDFMNQHAVYERFKSYSVPSRKKFNSQWQLHKYRDQILVDMPYERGTISHHKDIPCKYDKDLYKDVMKRRWDIYKNEPIRDAAGLCSVLRKICNSDPSRIEEVLKIVEERKKVIIFYNYNYELDILRHADYGPDVAVAEWNGHNHELIPAASKWVYLVQYVAGAEGWNCTQTDTMIFYSQNYSYKVMKQSAWRIDRANTTYIDLYYYHLKSTSKIDLAINMALKNKKDFNEKKFVC